MITSIDYFHCRPNIYEYINKQFSDEIRSIVGNIENSFTTNAIDIQNTDKRLK